MIRPFCGDGDVVAWIKKVKLVAKLQKVDDLASLLPLYLEGHALASYLEMEGDDQEDADKIEAKLKEVYADSPFSAHRKLTTLRWTGEPVDAFANEIRRLAGLAGFSNEGLERTVKLTFVNGFPDGVSKELQQVQDVLEQPLSAILSRARVLTEKTTTSVVAAVTGNSIPAAGFRGKCFNCGGPHMARHCKQRLTCYKCGKKGHISSQCCSVAVSQGNEDGETGAPAVAPGAH